LDGKRLRFTVAASSMAQQYDVMALYAELGGFDAILAVCQRWHELCVADPVAEHPFTHCGLHPQHTERLAAYLAQVTGGPALYTGGYGDESYVQRIHAGNGRHVDLDEACLRLFDRALADRGIPPEPAARLSTYFRTAMEAMRAYGASADLVPDGLPLRMA
jgi:hemoglobin